ncbi:MAG: hypothetical protein M3Y87_27605 [Myxococcota bacterium]|nr:hypothetical protein [Myxococcota bacterium]
MQEWLAVGDRQAAAERVRHWLIASYELAPVKVAPAPRAPARRARRTDER